MKNLIIILLPLLLIISIAPYCRADIPDAAGWVKVEIGKDRYDKWQVTLENDLLKCRYGWSFHNDPVGGQSYIREFRLKSVNQSMGDWLDAAAGKRGPFTNITLVYDGSDRKTVRLEWNNGDNVQDVTIYPNSLVLKIDYIRIVGFPHIVDVGSHGGSLYNPKFTMYGAEEWQALRKTNTTPSLLNHYNEHHRLTHDLYPMYPYPVIDTNDWYRFEPTPLNYNGYLILGVYKSASGVGYGRVMPYDVVNYLKLLDDGFEFFPFWRGPVRKFPFTGYLFLVDGGGSDEIIATGTGIVDMPTAVMDEGKPHDFVIDAIFPNPFNAETTIQYTLPRAEHVRLTVFNISGQAVAELVNSWKDSGTYHVLLRADTLSNGLYFCRLQTGAQISTRKMLLLK